MASAINNESILTSKTEAAERLTIKASSMLTYKSKPDNKLCFSLQILNDIRQDVYEQPVDTFCDAVLMNSLNSIGIGKGDTCASLLFLHHRQHTLALPLS